MNATVSPCPSLEILGGALDLTLHKGCMKGQGRGRDVSPSSCWHKDLCASLHFLEYVSRNTEAM